MLLAVMCFPGNLHRNDFLGKPHTMLSVQRWPCLDCAPALLCVIFVFLFLFARFAADPLLSSVIVLVYLIVHLIWSDFLFIATAGPHSSLGSTLKLFASRRPMFRYYYNMTKLHLHAAATTWHLQTSSPGFEAANIEKRGEIPKG